MVLVDTSVWVTRLRQSGQPRRDLCPVGSAPQDRSHEEVLHFIELHQLAGKGIGYVDVHLLASAQLTSVPLWTSDKALAKEAKTLGLRYV